MRLVSYLQDDAENVGILNTAGNALVGIRQVDGSLPATMSAFLERVTGDTSLSAKLSGVSDDPDLAWQSLEGASMLPVVPTPEKIICIGLNYADHAKESGAEIPSEPLVFNKFATALRGHGDEIALPPVSDSVDYEAELVVIIGKQAKNVSEADALSHVAGYTCGHDVSARDWQKNKPGGQWLCGKSFDSFAPIGPHLVTADEITDPHNLRIQLRLNGDVMQDSSTQQLIFNVPQLISYISQVCTLKPGDLIFTGTPPGVGGARKPPVYLKPGDVAEVEIESIGVLRNGVVQG